MTKAEYERTKKRCEDWIQGFKSRKAGMEPEKQDIDRLPRVKALFEKYNVLKSRFATVPVSPRLRPVSEIVICSPSPKKINDRIKKSSNVIIPASPDIKLDLVPRTLFKDSKREIQKEFRTRKCSKKLFSNSKILTTLRNDIEIHKSPAKNYEARKKLIFSSPTKQVFTTRKRNFSQRFSPSSIKIIGDEVKNLSHAQEIPGNSALCKVLFKSPPRVEKKLKKNGFAKTSKVKKPKLRKEEYVSENFVRLNLKRKAWQDRRKKKKFRNSGFHSSLENKK